MGADIDEREQSAISKTIYGFILFAVITDKYFRLKTVQHILAQQRECITGSLI